jgi:pimeloyl-ACP methyl ester carboxylesterase
VRAPTFSSDLLNSSRIRVYSAGRGAPLVFTHGFGDTAETWVHQVKHFAPVHRVLTWDLLGHGNSHCPEEEDAYSRDIALDDLNSVIDRADTDVVLIGHSLGGYLNQCRAILNPSRVRGLVLVATGPGYRNPEARTKWNRAVRKAGERFPVPLAAARLVEQRDALVMDHLERIQCPVLQIAGARDSAYHGAMRVLERRVKRVDSLIVADAGHHVHASHAEIVNEAIEAFLITLDV